MASFRSYKQQQNDITEPMMKVTIFMFEHIIHNSHSPSLSAKIAYNLNYNNNLATN